ncbi:LAFA_0C01178g1_1 [Lachancea sp. 'fantastica']|nr:LAFA_0C01178g1_1 [Lachancea sp. 'fantastica']
MGKADSWRYDKGSDTYESCESLDLGSGILLQSHKDSPMVFYNDVKFTSYCDNEMPVYSALVRTENSFPYLDAIQQDWGKFISVDDSDRGPFKYSIYAILVSFTANFIIVLSLTIIVFITVRQKPYRGASNLLKLGSSLASINLTIFVAKALDVLKDEHINKGIVSTDEVLDLLSHDTAFTCLDFFVVLICELCQVQIVMRLFSRVREKRLVFFTGIILSIISQVLWAIPSFSKLARNHYMGESYDEDGLILLSPFVYLMRITFSAFFASIIIFNVFIKRQLCLHNQRMTLLTLITILIIFLQPAFFVADVTNIWVDDLSEIFNTTCYVGSAVIVWQWVDSLLILERKVQAQSVLGRPVYEDDQEDNYFARYALKTQEPTTVNDSTSGNSDSSAPHGNIPSQVVNTLDANKVEFSERPPVKERVWQGCTRIIDGMLYYTDHFIVKGLVIKTLSFQSKNSSDDYSKRKAKVRRRIGLDRPNEIYVYATRDVIFDSDEADDDSVVEEEGDSSRGDHEGTKMSV